MRVPRARGAWWAAGQQKGSSSRTPVSQLRNEDFRRLSCRHGPVITTSELEGTRLCADSETIGNVSAVAEITTETINFIAKLCFKIPLVTFAKNLFIFLEFV